MLASYLTLQVLSEDQDSLHFTRSQYFGGSNFTIPNVHYPLSAINEDLCSIFESSYLCVQFAAGDDSQPEKKQVPFFVEGVFSEWNMTETASHLIKCVPYVMCGGNVTQFAVIFLRL